MSAAHKTNMLTVAPPESDEQKISNEEVEFLTRNADDIHLTK